jgi:putative addiction module killer protein
MRTYDEGQWPVDPDLSGRRVGMNADLHLQQDRLASRVFAQIADHALATLRRARVQARIERLAAGNPGDVRPVGEGVSELRIDYGPGYRVYFAKRKREVVILLAGGDKSTQSADTETALRLARNL